MVKTQVQIPDELYRKAKAIAKAREWSLAEVFRRGLEYMARTNPVDEVDAANGEWELPKLTAQHFVSNFDDLDLKQLAAEDEVRSL
ncbi:MAG: hypothetical protein ACC661_10210 [Verrucomicrobiales bacterium]